MGCKAAISEDVFSIMRRLAQSLPVDRTAVTFEDVLAHPLIAQKQYSAQQVVSALALLCRNHKLSQVGKGEYEVILRQKPVRCWTISRQAPELGLSGEAIHFWQMSHYVCRRAAA